MEATKTENTTETTETTTTSPSSNDTSESTLQQYQEIMRQKILSQHTQVEDKSHIFWDTQPVPKLNDKFDENGPIDEIKTPADVRQEPYGMPKGFEWVSLDVNDPVQLTEIYTLLTENYVEDDDNMFRFDYSREFLQWALQPPGYLQEWHVGVRTSNNGKLVGFITAIPADISVQIKFNKW
eukprot:CAMPEP_0174819418 /NCGR_PEP_ID=MMETSP1107-20130205/2634_1 /TAXON_ID=36770 /ORGANISM="Paraphysomonas vestita, Strain GFlagA" /LENGTH=180 /DNA_ID=CAMNT_0016032861 /DNA_START=23 /DNA_END=566 /DNA_ORIENTATION=-